MIDVADTADMAAVAGERGWVVLHEAQVEAVEWHDPVRGRLRFRTLFSSDVTPTGALTAGMAELEPGGWLGRHRHDPNEVYHVVAGRGWVTLDGVEQEVAAGSSVFIRGGVEHGVCSAADSGLRFFYTFPTDAFDDVEYRFTDAG